MCYTEVYEAQTFRTPCALLCYNALSYFCNTFPGTCDKHCTPSINVKFIHRFCCRCASCSIHRCTKNIRQEKVPFHHFLSGKKLLYFGFAVDFCMTVNVEGLIWPFFHFPLLPLKAGKNMPHIYDMYCCLWHMSTCVMNHGALHDTLTRTCMIELANLQYILAANYIFYFL
jgi:hypothetical protein